MKKLITALVCLFAINSNAQTYVPFDFEHSEWYMSESIEHHDIGGPFFYYYDYKIAYSGRDTVINGLSYHTLYHYSVLSSDTTYKSWDGEEYFLREDNKKIYALYNYPLSVSEYIVYDYNLGIGDSIEITDIYPNQIPALKLKVIAKDSINTAYGYRNRLTLECTSYNLNGNIEWIEGIGSNMGLLYNMTLEDTQGFETFVNHSFLCYKLNNVHTYGGVCYYYTLIGLDENKTEKLFVFPNPTASTLTINADLKGKIAVELFNATGQLVMSENYQALPQKQFDVSALPNGIYYLRMQNNGQYYSQKIVVEK